MEHHFLAIRVAHEIDEQASEVGVVLAGPSFAQELGSLASYASELAEWGFVEAASRNLVHCLDGAALYPLDTAEWAKPLMEEERDVALVPSTEDLPLAVGKVDAFHVVVQQTGDVVLEVHESESGAVYRSEPLDPRELPLNG
ncbi:hypothetical protein Ocepr_2274 (plasmid) [Oceanithermus profundus DSM 14977]|uniref:Uncharacterized protein n=1 Tax=Oceanithermus profundus (strain DSM 14977 / NBRC 100410 / VKM B-2274 / 506) TaxID=670487 RepID=E4UAT7_OCEP5|nr:hypothetical protein [Oceanithermus profundus]ADR37722.1 hypothetical protein Ocepr_2274 [Oceanithermus profundus DSM 14977]